MLCSSSGAVLPQLALRTNPQTSLSKQEMGCHSDNKMAWQLVILRPQAGARKQCRSILVRACHHFSACCPAVVVVVVVAVVEVVAVVVDVTKGKQNKKVCL